jgi:hypothetical protein
MDIQKELKALDSKTQKLRTTYGRRFHRFYEQCVSNQMANNRVIEDATKANKVVEKDLQAARMALESVNYTV